MAWAPRYNNFHKVWNHRFVGLIYALVARGLAVSWAQVICDPGMAWAPRYNNFSQIWWGNICTCCQRSCCELGTSHFFRATASQGSHKHIFKNIFGAPSLKETLYATLGLVGGINAL